MSGSDQPGSGRAQEPQRDELLDLSPVSEVFRKVSRLYQRYIRPSADGRPRLFHRAPSAQLLRSCSCITPRFVFLPSRLPVWNFDNFGFEVVQVFIVFRAEPFVAFHERLFHDRTAPVTDSHFHLTLPFFPGHPMPGKFMSPRRTASSSAAAAFS